jgi:hypothetical protein
MYNDGLTRDELVETKVKLLGELFGCVILLEYPVLVWTTEALVLILDTTVDKFNGAV